MILLLTKMFICSVILFGYYWLFLRNKKFHHYNRFYLLMAAILSIIIPFMRIPLFPGESAPWIERSVGIISVNQWEDEFTGPSVVGEAQNYTQFLIGGVYAAGVIVLIGLLFKSLVYIRKLTRRYPFEQVNELRIYNTTETGTPFSFFQSIFWNKQLDVNSPDGQKIFRHELFHVKQRHSADILFLELVTIICWFNPVFHLIKREIKAIHEFLADQYAISQDNRYDYAELLIMQTISRKKLSLSNFFFQNHIKRRIAMITQFKNKKYSYWSRLMVLPLLVFLFLAVALHSQGPSERQVSVSEKLSQAITVLIDPGHGGQDNGAKSQDGQLNEKDIVLEISKKITEQAARYNIKVITTRNSDLFPSLKERVDLAATSKVDLIVSLHVAAAPGDATANGFEFFVTKNNTPAGEESKRLGVSIAEQINSFYKTGNIKQRNNQGIYILDKASCPSIIVECGYMTNPTDLSFITQEANQEKIAAGILEGIVKYKGRAGRSVAMVESNTGKQALSKTFIVSLPVLSNAQPKMISDTVPNKDSVKAVQEELNRARQEIEELRKENDEIRKQLVNQKNLENKHSNIQKHHQELINRKHELEQKQNKIERQNEAQIRNEKQRALKEERLKDLEEKAITDNEKRKIRASAQELQARQRELEIAQEKLHKLQLQEMKERQTEIRNNYKRDIDQQQYNKERVHQEQQEFNQLRKKIAIAEKDAVLQKKRIIAEHEAAKKIKREPTKVEKRINKKTPRKPAPEEEKL